MVEQLQKMVDQWQNDGRTFAGALWNNSRRIVKQVVEQWHIFWKNERKWQNSGRTMVEQWQNMM